MSRFDDDKASVGPGLERWYAERGSREFTGVYDLTRLQPRVRVVVECSVDGCPEPAKITEFGLEAFCANHYPAVVG